MTKLQCTKDFTATKELLGLKYSTWGKAQGTRNLPATRELPSLCPERCSCWAGGTLPATVATSFPLFAGVSGGVKACIVRYASSVHGMAKLELSPPLFLYVFSALGLCLLLSIVVVAGRQQQCAL
jgi:hypothetical protein